MPETLNEPAVKELFERFEYLSERGDYAAALELIDRTCLEAAFSARPDWVVEALNHKLHVYKHLYQKTGEAIYLDSMGAVANLALDFCEKHRLTGPPKAAALLRYADACYLKADLVQAVEFYQRALAEIPPLPEGRYAEYLSHWAVAKIKLNQDPAILVELEKALTLAKNDATLRPFHQLIILSGIQARLAESYAALGRPREAEAALAEAETLAGQLEKTYAMPMRRIQLETLKRQLSPQ